MKAKALASVMILTLTAGMFAEGAKGSTPKKNNRGA